MSSALAQRLLALAGVALLAGLLALIAKPESSNGKGDLPPGVSAPKESEWRQALAASHGDNFAGKQLNCGYKLDSDSLGVANQIYDCGTKFWIRYKGHLILTQQLAQGPTPAGTAFELTPALASKLGITGTQQIEWQLNPKKGSAK